MQYKQSWNFITIYGDYRNRVGIGLSYRPTRLAGTTARFLLGSLPHKLFFNSSTHVCSVASKNDWITVQWRINWAKNNRQKTYLICRLLPWCHPPAGTHLLKIETLGNFSNKTLWYLQKWRELSVLYLYAKTCCIISHCVLKSTKHQILNNFVF